MDQDVHIALVVDGERIIATLPGTAFHVTYFKTDKGSGLFQGAGIINDHAASISMAQFELLAWTAAVDKARQLGWIS